MSIWNLATDKDVEKNGVWRDFPDDNDVPVRFLIARQGGGNSPYLKELEREIRPLRRSSKNGTQLDPEIQKQILIRVLAKTVLVGWENVLDRAGNPLPYSVENAIDLLSAIDVVFDYVQEESALLSNYRAEALEDEAKNL